MCWRPRVLGWTERACSYSDGRVRVCMLTRLDRECVYECVCVLLGDGVRVRVRTCQLRETVCQFARLFLIKSRNTELQKRATRMQHTRNLHATQTHHIRNLRATRMQHTRNLRATRMQHTRNLRATRMQHIRNLRATRMQHIRNLRATRMQPTCNTYATCMQHIRNLRATRMQHIGHIHATHDHSVDICMHACACASIHVSVSFRGFGVFLL